MKRLPFMARSGNQRLDECPLRAKTGRSVRGAVNTGCDLDPSGLFKPVYRHPSRAT